MAFPDPEACMPIHAASRSSFIDAWVRSLLQHFREAGDRGKKWKVEAADSKAIVWMSEQELHRLHVGYDPWKRFGQTPGSTCHPLR